MFHLSNSHSLGVKEAKVLEFVQTVKVKVCHELKTFRTFFFFGLLEWLPTLTNSKYIDLFRTILPPLKIEKRSNLRLYHLD